VPHSRKEARRLAGAPSLAGLPQRIIIGFVEAFDFVAVEALVFDFQVLT
jgi:hypothetical protein